jgi:hypothetical protein
MKKWRKLAGYVAHMREKYKVFFGKPKRRRLLREANKIKADLAKTGRELEA